MKPQDDAASEVTRLLRLKRYEQPDAGFDARVTAGIRTRIAALPERVSWGQRVWSWFEQTPAPALRYAMVTALVALVGINVLTLSLIPERDAVSRMTNEAPVIVQREDQPTAAPTNEAIETYAKPVFVFEYPASNLTPRGGVQYGTGPTVPVRFDR
jgi:hypothetical protein